MKYKLILILTVVFLLFKCKTNEDSKKGLFLNLNSKYNFFDIQKTDFTYKGLKIYQMNNYDTGNKYFTESNYLLVDGSKVFSIFNFSQDEKIINKHKLLFDDLNNTDTLNPNDIADYKFLILDFNLSPKDSVKSKPGELILKNKFYDKFINDTVYLFSRKFKWNEKITNIAASKNIGILGLYDYVSIDKKNKEIFNYYGLTYQWLLDNTYHISRNRQTQPYKKKVPILQLDKVKFLKKE